MNNLYREFKLLSCKFAKRDIINKLEIHKVTKENIGEFLDKLHDDELEEDLYEKDQKKKKNNNNNNKSKIHILRYFGNFGRI